MEKDMTLAYERRSMTTFTAFAGIATRALALAANGVLKNVRNLFEFIFVVAEYAVVITIAYYFVRRNDAFPLYCFM